MMFKNWNVFKHCYQHLKHIKSSGFRNEHSSSFINILKNLPEAQCFQLENGVTIATEERHTWNTCLGLYIDAGSRYESKSDNGITHFFEHMAFTGTRTRAKTDIEAIMLATGAKFQCFTTREMSAYFVECLSSDVPITFDLLLDCVINNVLNHSEIEAQKQIVCLEMLQLEKNVTNVLFDYLHLSAYQGTPLGQTITGPSYNISQFSTKSFSTLLHQRFTPDKIVLTAVGGIKTYQIIEIAKNYLCNLKCVKSDDFHELHRYTGSEIRYRNDELPLAHVAMAVEGPSFCDNDYIIMEIAKTVVGGWDKTQLGGLSHGTPIARAASCEGLCEFYKSFNICYKDTSLWGVHFISSKLDLEDMVYLIQDEWMNICNTITDQEVDRAKNQFTAELLSKSESAVRTSHRIGRFMLYRKSYPSFYESVKAIDSISADDVKSVCYKYIYDKCPVVAAVGPTEGLTDYSRIRSGMYWLRL